MMLLDIFEEPKLELHLNTSSMVFHKIQVVHEVRIHIQEVVVVVHNNLDSKVQVQNKYNKVDQEVQSNSPFFIL